MFRKNGEHIQKYTEDPAAVYGSQLALLKRITCNGAVAPLLEVGFLGTQMEMLPHRR